MTTVFPTNNLPTASQPWAREVQKQLVNLIASDNSERINNTARDNQLNSSIIALSGVVSQVTTALTEIGLLQDTVLVDGEPTKINGANIKVGTLSASSITTGELSATRISGGTLNAALMTVTNLNAGSITAGTFSGDRISGGTITGVTIQSAAFGTRVVMESSDLAFYFDSTYVGKIQGSDNSWTSDAALTLISATGGAQISLDGSEISLFATSSGQGLGVGNFENVSYGNFRCTNQLTSNGLIQSGGNMRSGGTLGRIELDNAPAVTGASINTSGNIIRTSSSARYKTDISELNISYDSIINAPSPKTFRLKDDVFGSEENGFQSNENARYYAGFIAEDFADTDLGIFVSHMNTNDGQIPDGFYYAEFTSALLIAIKEQHKKIEKLTDRIETLEKGA